MIPLTMRHSCVNTLIFGSLWVTFAVHAAPPIQAALEPSAFLDTESSTSFAFTAASDRAGEFRYSLTFEANASNNVQIAFGTDADRDGILSLDETDLAIGWRCGTWLVRDREGRALREEPASATNLTQTLSCRVRLNASGVATEWSFADLSGPILAGLPAPLDPSWDLFRLTSRGVGAADPAASVQLLPDGLHVILK